MRRFLYRVACRVERVPGLAGRCWHWLCNFVVESIFYLGCWPFIGWYFFRYPTLSVREAAEYFEYVCGFDVCPERLCELERKMNSIREDD